MASATAVWTAIEVVVAPVTVSTSRFLDSRMRAAIIGAAVEPMPIVSSQRSTLTPAMSPPATVTCTYSVSSWPMAVPIHLPSVKLSGTLFCGSAPSFWSSAACCGAAHPARAPSAATLPIASDPLRKFLRSSSMVAPSLLWVRTASALLGARRRRRPRWCSGASGERIRVAAWCCPRGASELSCRRCRAGWTGSSMGRAKGRVDTDRGCFSGKGMRTPPRFSVIFAFHLLTRCPPAD